LFNLFRRLAAARRAARPTGPVAMAAIAVFAVATLAGCGSHQASTSGSSSSQGPSGSGSSQSSSFRQCLKEHGVTAPAGGGGGGSGGGIPAAHPSGSAASSFRQAAQACGFGGHRGSAGGGALPGSSTDARHVPAAPVAVRARQAALFHTGQRRHRTAGGTLIAFWEFRGGIAGPVIPVATLIDQLPRFANSSGPYRLPRISLAGRPWRFLAGSLLAHWPSARAAKLCGHRPGFLHSTSSAADDN